MTRQAREQARRPAVGLTQCRTAQHVDDGGDLVFQFLGWDDAVQQAPFERGGGIDRPSGAPPIVTPASMCRSLMRSRRTAAASASSTRVFTPSVSSGSGAT